MKDHANPDPSTPPEYVDDRYLAAHTPISRSQWQLSRRAGGGPPFMKVGRRCLYKWSDVVAWLDAQTVGAK
ncbi:MAG TPA: hypothetical protein VGL61_31825 [Kofleriaceae bacterium]|jgi:hypothetical protein